MTQEHMELKSKAVIREALIELFESIDYDIGSDTLAHGEATLLLVDAFLTGKMAMYYDVTSGDLKCFVCDECPRWKEMGLKRIENDK